MINKIVFTLCLVLGTFLGHSQSISLSDFEGKHKDVAVVHFNEDGKVGILKKNRVLLSYKYDDAFTLNDKLIVLKKEEKWYIFSTKTEKFINHQNIIDVSIFDTYHMTFKGENGLWGLLDTLGTVQIEPICEQISVLDDLSEMSSFQKENLWGLLNKDGVEVVVPQYEEILFSTLAPLMSVKLDGKSGVIDTTGKIVIPLVYDDVTGMSSDLVAIRQNNKWGFVNHKNEVKIPIIYEDCGGFNLGLAPVKNGEKWGYIDKNNTLKIPYLFNYASFFSATGKAEVHNGKKWIFIDTTGKCVAECDD